MNGTCWAALRRLGLVGGSLAWRVCSEPDGKTSEYYYFDSDICSKHLGYSRFRY